MKITLNGRIRQGTGTVVAVSADETEGVVCCECDRPQGWSVWRPQDDYPAIVAAAWAAAEAADAAFDAACLSLQAGTRV